MKNQLSTIVLFLFAFQLNAQVGIGTNTPKATLDIVAKHPTGNLSDLDGLLVPRVDRERMQSMDGLLAGTLVYCNDVSTGDLSGNAANIQSKGYYFYDGNLWLKIITDAASSNIYVADGDLSGNRTINLDGKTFRIANTTGAGIVNQFSIAGNVFSIDAANARVGIGTAAPKSTLEIAGKPSDAAVVDGILPPSLTGDELKAKDAVYTTAQKGVMVYVSDLPNGTTAKTANISATGYYIFDGSVWQGISKTYTAGEGIEIVNNQIRNKQVPPAIIIENTKTDPTGITEFGGSYIVATGATGLWAGKDNMFAKSTDNGATWVFTNPVIDDKRTITTGVNAGKVYKWDGVNWIVSGVTSLGTDIGYILGWQSNIAPPDFLLPLSGGTYDKADYQELMDAHAIYTFQFIASTTATTFTLQNFNDQRVLSGKAGEAGATGGSNTKTIAQNNLPNVNLTAQSNGDHTHRTGVTWRNDESTLEQAYGNEGSISGYASASARSSAGSAGSYTNRVTGVTNSTGAHTHTVPLNGNVTQQAFDVQSAYVNVLWCIKAKPTGGASNVTLNQTIVNSGANIGDIKQGFQGSDHGGWVKLDGRAISSLNSTQQNNALSLGLSGNLPNANNAYLSQNGQAIGSVTGQNTKTIAQNNLPNATLSGTTNSTGAHTHSYSDRGGGNYGIAAADGPNVIEDNGNNGRTTGSNGAHSHTLTTGSINGGVTQQAFDVRPSTMSANVFVFLGN